MFPILRLFPKLALGVKRVALAALFVVPAFAEDSIPVFADSLLAERLVDSARVDVNADTVEKDSLVKDSASRTASAIKSVLYFGGGDRSPWYDLGVLYAIEEYKIPVDSIVATSWGAYVGYLWSLGVSVDEIQRLLLDPAVVSYVGQDLSLEKMHSKEGCEMEVSPQGIPSIRERFTLRVDSGHVGRNLRSLEVDSAYIRRSLARVRLQESLYRQGHARGIPFDVQGCDGASLGNTPESVMESLPLWESAADSSGKISGELCPHYALPLEDRADELALIVVADPLRSEIQGDARKQVLLKQAALNLSTQPGVIIRAHTVLDTARNVWIQAGFTAVERKLKDMEPLANRKVDYSVLKKPAALPWFRFTPSFDGVSSELLSSLQSRWPSAKADTGLTAPVHFALSVGENPAYDSLQLSMQPNGELMVGTVVHPTFDIAAGGFGSNAIGANGYLEATVNYVDQMEIMLSLKGFWGSSSYGFTPRLDISRLWNRHWALQFGYDWMKLRPLKSFNNDVDSTLRIYSENRNDFTMSLQYHINEEQVASVDFLFGGRSFKMNKALYGSDPIKTYPVAPSLHYNFTRGENSPWFSTEGFSLDAVAGLESIGFDFGINDVVPIYWKFILDGRYTVSPKSFATFTIGASAGVERYHEDGYGYVEPKSFGYAPLDVVYRLHGNATPWSSQWNDPELSSHEFGLVRVGASLHKGVLGLWLFGAYFKDFEESPYAKLKPNKFVLEPAIRLSYKSISIYAGMNRVVDSETLGDLKRFKDYTYFIRVGEYEF